MISEIDKYTYRVTWSEEDEEFVGLCAEFPKLSWLATGPEIASSGCRGSARWRKYSGKFMVRVPPEVHRSLATQAAESGVSLNRIASAKLAH